MQQSSMSTPARVLVVARVTIRVVVWDLLLEVVGTIRSTSVACRGGKVEPYVLMYSMFQPCAFRVDTALFHTASSNGLANNVAQMLTIRSLLSRQLSSPAVPPTPRS